MSSFAQQETTLYPILQKIYIYMGLCLIQASLSFMYLGGGVCCPGFRPLRPTLATGFPVPWKSPLSCWPSDKRQTSNKTRKDRFINLPTAPVSLGDRHSLVWEERFNRVHVWRLPPVISVSFPPTYFFLSGCQKKKYCAEIHITLDG